MRILINKFAGHLLRSHVPAHAGFTSNEFRYYSLIDSIAGTWIDVDTKYVFDPSHNGVMPVDGSLISIPKSIVSVATEVDCIRVGEMSRAERVSIITAIRTRQTELEAEAAKIDRKGYTRNVQLSCDRLNRKQMIRFETQWLDEVCTNYFGL